MWTSLGKSIGDFVEERLTSPLISSFVLAWIGVNYKFFVLLFSKNTASETFRLIEQFCFPDWQSRLVQGFFLPLVLALMYLYVLPIPARKVYGHWRGNLRKTDEIKLEHEINKRLTVEESREIKKRVNDLEIESDTKDQLIRNLRTELQGLYNSNEDINKLKAEYTETQVKMGEALGELARTRANEKTLKDQIEYVQRTQADLIKTARAGVLEVTQQAALTFTELGDLKSYAQFRDKFLQVAHRDKDRADQAIDELTQYEAAYQQDLHVAYTQLVTKLKEIFDRIDQPDSFAKPSPNLS